MQAIDRRELDAALEELDLNQEDARDKWRVRDEETARRYIRICKSVADEKNAAMQARAQEVERVERFYNKEIENLEGKLNFFEELLKDWYTEQRAANPKYKFSTPWGKISQRTITAADWKDESALLDWLKQNGKSELINVKESIKKADVKNVMQAVGGHLVDAVTGEILPGVEINKKTTISVKTEVGDNAND